MPEAYASFAVEFEADLSRVQSGLQGGLSMARLYGEQYGSQFASGMTEAVGNLSGGVAMLQGLRGQFASTAQGLSEIFGMKAGSEMAYFRRQLVGMTGDAATAEKTLAGLVDIANKTSYGNMDIFQLATNALGSGTSADNLKPEVSNILDAAAGIGINDPAVFRRFSRNLFDIRGKTGEASQRDVNELYRQAPQFVFQAAKVLGTTATGARDQINGMSGADLYNLITRIGESNKGRAAAEGMADPFVAAANAADLLATAMAPTGEMINKVLTPGIAMMGMFLSSFAGLNKAGAGIPGFILAFSVVRAAYGYHVGVVRRLDMALNNLAGTANRAAVNKGGGSGIDAMGAFSKGLLVADMAVMAVAAGQMAGDFLAKSAFHGYDAAGPDDKVRLTELEAKRFSMGGFNFGAGNGGDRFGNTDPDTSANDTKTAAGDLKEAAKFLKDATADGYGYGKRGKATLSSIEAGYALLGAERLGIA